LAIQLICDYTEDQSEKLVSRNRATVMHFIIEAIRRFGANKI